jgi:hypothetical protein
MHPEFQKKAPPKKMNARSTTSNLPRPSVDADGKDG